MDPEEYSSKRPKSKGYTSHNVCYIHSRKYRMSIYTLITRRNQDIQGLILRTDAMPISGENPFDMDYIPSFKGISRLYIQFKEDISRWVFKASKGCISILVNIDRLSYTPPHSLPELLSIISPYLVRNIPYHLKYSDITIYTQ